ncbi:glycosyltransferase family 1 protein [Rhodocaloribacter litoris]|uniref:glycosyltransferase family 4 protein n=1 Tax=Rhodocaloribacter litoris TaxID=2558931 RepID=UPI0014213603|nr:glycosyltransferase family 1 protein [Rhodocaloribacter litoris]QXD13709.1 glycosyltransferase family 1 protein [Rhodocaloribacter litoris]
MAVTPERARAETPRRIALFTGAYNHIADGVSLTLNRLVAYLEDRDVEVEVFAPTVDHPPIRHNGTLIPVPSFALPGRSEYRVSLGLSRTARRALRLFKPTLFHVATPDFLGLHAMRMAMLWKTPIVSSYHTHFSSYLSYYNIEWLDRPIWLWLRWYYARCAHLYVPTPTMIDVLKAHGVRANFRLWPRGVDTGRFNPQRRDPGWRRTLGIEDDEVVVAFVGRLVREKGTDIFAGVIKGLRRRGIPHRTLIVGDGPARPELAARLPEAVFTGFLAGEELARAYASADVFVFPSATETFGNVTLEAMASGLPAVCADAPGSNSLVVHGETGYLAPPGRTDVFLEYVVNLVEDAALRRQMSRAALQRARTYDWDAVMARMLTYYDEILNPPEPADRSPRAVRRRLQTTHGSF